MRQPVIKIIVIILVAELSTCGPTAEQLAGTFVAETAAAASPTPRPTSTGVACGIAEPLSGKGHFFSL